jgi:hypothetical protein
MNGTQPTLFAEPATARAIAEARAIVFMVGSYDGSANFGDIAQFQAALSLVERLQPALLPVPVLERPERALHRTLVEAGGPAPARPVFFDPSGAIADDLLPVPAPVSLAFGASYLYGGGYLNGSWGDRKLAMLRSAESLLAAGGAPAPCRVASGLQVDADWISGLAAEDAATLRAFEFLGVRDAGSGPALEALGSATPVSDSADDAVALLGALPAGSPAGNGALRVNLHFAEHEWVSGRPAEVLGFYTAFLRELGRQADRPLAVQPLLAYFGGRVDEGPAAERLREACAAIAGEVAAPLPLRPATLAETAPALGEADLTLSCSYHVALTSLMLGVPAVLLGDNPYYKQKAAGLAADFGLPPAFLPNAETDPAGSAAAVAAAALGPGRSELRGRLATRAEERRRRRAAAELELLSRLGTAAIGGIGARVGELEERLRERASEPAELHARLAALGTELEELRQRVAESPLDAELRVQEAEARADAAHTRLAELLGSRSWKLGEPLRRAGARLRRR